MDGVTQAQWQDWFVTLHQLPIDRIVEFTVFPDAADPKVIALVYPEDRPTSIRRLEAMTQLVELRPLMRDVSGIGEPARSVPDFPPLPKT